MEKERWSEDEVMTINGVEYVMKSKADYLIDRKSAEADRCEHGVIRPDCFKCYPILVPRDSSPASVDEVNKVANLVKTYQWDSANDEQEALEIAKSIVNILSRERKGLVGLDIDMAWKTILFQIECHKELFGYHDGTKTCTGIRGDKFNMVAYECAKSICSKFGQPKTEYVNPSPLEFKAVSTFLAGQLSYGELTNLSEQSRKSIAEYLAKHLIIAFGRPALVPLDEKDKGYPKYSCRSAELIVDLYMAYNKETEDVNKHIPDWKFRKIGLPIVQDYFDTLIEKYVRPQVPSVESIMDILNPSWREDAPYRSIEACIKSDMAKAQAIHDLLNGCR